MTIKITKTDNQMRVEDTQLNNTLKVKPNKHGMDISLYSGASDSLGEISLSHEQMIQIAQYIMYRQPDHYCPSCDAKMEYGTRKKNEYEDTHAWTCPSCPMILVEYYDHADAENINKINFGEKEVKEALEIADITQTKNEIVEGSKVNILVEKLEKSTSMKWVFEVIEKFGANGHTVLECLNDDNSHFDYKVEIGEVILFFYAHEIELAKDSE